MKAHRKATTGRLQRMHETLVAEAAATADFLESERRLLVNAQAERNSNPRPCYRLPLALVRKIESLAQRVKHGEWLVDKACTARNAIRDLMQGGQIDL